MADRPMKVGMRVEVAGKGLVGTVAYVGTTMFASGKWVGVVLDEKKGKNNGTVQGKKYFNCDDGYGIFVRQSQLNVLEDQSGGSASTPSTPSQEEKSVSKRTPGARAPRPRSTAFETPRASRGSRENLESIPQRKTPSSSSKPPTRSASSTELKTSKTANSDQQTKKSKKSPTSSNLDETIKEMKSPTQPSKDSSKSKESTPLSTPVSTPVGPTQAEMDEKDRNIGELTAKVKDLEEKLDTIKVKRLEDKGKLKEFEKSKIEIQKLLEFKSKMQEAKNDLEKQLKEAKKEAKEALDAKEQFEEEMKDVTETIEIATLDKEMAEEKCEAQQLEVDQLRERLEEAQTDLELLKNEIATSGTEGAATSFQVKQMEEQNNRLRDALVKMRDLSQSEKQENQKLQKEIDKNNSQLKTLTQQKEKLSKEVEEAEATVDELKEQVDAALGAEEMVEHLTERNLQQEERIQELEEQVGDLEAMHEMDEEMQESARDNEIEMREEIDMANSKVREFQRKLEASQEMIADLQQTITKYRDLTTQLREKNEDLAEQTAELGKQEPTTPVETFDFKAKFAEVKAHAKQIDMELRKLEVQQANQHVNLLCAFMPDNFHRRGGDHDCIQVLLLIPRMVCKAQLLADQVRDKHESIEEQLYGPDEEGEEGESQQFEIPQGGLDRAQVVRSHVGEQLGFANHLIYSLAIFQSILHKYDKALNSCSVELYMKVGTLYPEMAMHERALDHLIDLLKKDQLDETVSMEALNKAIAFYQAARDYLEAQKRPKHLYSVHLMNEVVDCTTLLGDHLRITSAAQDSVQTDLNRLKVLLHPGQETSDFAILLKDLETSNGDCRQFAKKIKRHMPGEESSRTLSFGQEVHVQDSLADCAKHLDRLVRCLQDITAGAMSQAALLGDNEGIQAKKLEELAFKVSDQVYGKDDTGPFEAMRMSFSLLIIAMNKLSTAMMEGEYDFQGPPEPKDTRPYAVHFLRPSATGPKPQPPVAIRATKVKGEILDSEGMGLKLEDRETVIRELKKSLKIKSEELSETNVRIGLLEKKLDNATKESDSKTEYLKVQLEETNEALRKKEEEFERTMDALQGDIDSLEAEKAELKLRLNQMSKRSLLEGLTRHQAAPSGIAAVVAGAASGSDVVTGDVSWGEGVGSPTSGVVPMTTGQTLVRDSPLLLQQIDVLRVALHHVKQENFRLQAQKMNALLAGLPPLKVPKKPVGLISRTGLVQVEGGGGDAAPSRNKLGELTRKTDKLLTDLFHMSACPKVVDISHRKPGTVPVLEKATPAHQLAQNTARIQAMQKAADQLHNEVQALVAAQRKGGQVRGDFAAFTSPELAKAMEEKENCVCVGRVSLPSVEKGLFSVQLQPKHLREIHSKFIS
ncbi:dynactin subunit 1-like isoform X4 [Branchiostoma floridae]|uniref:Dynactin subunit 1 n=1 Tax=Branchiostoma floridae TaxID=7739 RepID=A0A9J7KYZ5_BRAFL|nr:dynactin subunit 1-like isoform X4 [Branchiostoma floridae]